MGSRTVHRRTTAIGERDGPIDHTHADGDNPKGLEIQGSCARRVHG